MFYLLLFLALPIMEIVVFIAAGSEIGILSTFLLCIATAGLGVALIRQQGVQTMMNARARLERNEAPIGEMLDGVCLFAAGVLLVVPGFITDALGFTLLIPQVRHLMKAKIGTNPRMFMHGTFSGTDAFKQQTDPKGRPGNKPFSQTDVIEGEYKDLTEDTSKSDRDKPHK